MTAENIEILNQARESFVRKRRAMAEQMIPAGAAAQHFAPAFADLRNAIEAIDRAIADAVACLLDGRRCQLEARNALIATEIIFGAYESSRRRGRVDFPLDIDDNPLASMVEDGSLTPAPMPVAPA